MKQWSEPVLVGRALSTDRLGDAVYTRIRDAIISGELPPGSPVGVPALAEALGVSRSPVRDAILRLTHEGLVHTRARRGATVVLIRPEDLERLYEVREVLEGLAARLAALSSRPAADDELAEVIAAHSRAIANVNIPEHIELDVTFHRMVREMSGNPEVERLLRDIDARVRLAMLTTTIASGPERALQEHKAIYQAIRVHDSEGAEHAARSHIARLRLSLKAAKLSAAGEDRAVV